MASVGACLLANEPDGLGDKMLQRRIEGKSWKEIADEFGLGSPSTARKQFTKLTGITDYKSKGPALKAIAQQTKGLAEGQAKQAAAAVKSVDVPTAEPVKPSVAKAATKKAAGDPFDEWNKVATDINDMYGPGKADELFEELNKGTGYMNIQQKTGVQIKDIDAYNWHKLKAENKGHSIWTVYKKKPTSEFGFNDVQAFVHQVRKDFNMTPGDIEVTYGIPKSVTDAILKGEWKLPSPGATSPVIPPAPPQSTGVIGGEFKYHPISKWNQWADSLGSDMTQAELSSVRAYTGSGYRAINGYLRSGTGHHTNPTHVKNIDNVMRPIPFDARVTRQLGTDGFRSMGISDPRDLHKHVGKVFSDDGYYSTTIVEKGVWGGDIRLQIDMPQGTLGRWVGNGVSQHTNEKEFILARGTKMMITGVEDHGRGVIVHMRVV